MKREVVQKLVKLADSLDKLGLTAEANNIDTIIIAAVKRSGKDTWKYESHETGEFSRDSAGIWSSNTPHFALRHQGEINKLEVGESIELKTQVGEKIKVTRTGKLEIEGANTPPAPEKDKLIQELKNQRKSLNGKRRWVSTMMNEMADEKNMQKLWPYLDKGRDHEEWRLEFSPEPDNDPLVSKIPLTEKTTDKEISNIATQLLAAVQKLLSVN